MFVILTSETYSTMDVRQDWIDAKRKPMDIVLVKYLEKSKNSILIKLKQTLH